MNEQEHHRTTCRTLRQALQDAGCELGREVCKTDTESKHTDLFQFWIGPKGSIFIMHQRTPNAGAVCQLPLVDVYSSVDRSNTIEGTIRGILNATGWKYEAPA
jgi:hypothetical protein